MPIGGGGGSGGGSFGGGGFGGSGSFGGGGSGGDIFAFGGGGHRGSAPTFRSGSSGGSPFGRTGAQRTITRGPRGHNYYGRHRDYHQRYGSGLDYRPWYSRGYRFWGSPDDSWYYSPVTITGGVILGILLLLLIIPLVGFMAVPYPASTTRDIQYSKTQTITYNEYWYESEYMSAGNTISYSVQANGPVSFAIANHQFNGFPLTATRTNETYNDNFQVKPNEHYRYESFYLYKGDYFNYTFSTSGVLRFFIADGPNINNWNYYNKLAKVYKENDYARYGNGSFTAPHAQDWYLVWYNTANSGPPINVQIAVNSSVSSIDLNQAHVHVLDTQQVNPGTYTVPNGGTYYFFIYFDPALSSAQNVTISFAVTYHQKLSSNDSWKQMSPVLIFLVIIISVLLIIAFVQRSSARRYEKDKKKREASKDGLIHVPIVQKHKVTKQRKNKKEQKGTSYSQSTGDPAGGTGGEGRSLSTTQEAETTSEEETRSSGSEQQCHVCGKNHLTTDTFCPNCGTRLIGRDYGVPTQTTPAGSQNCVVCGQILQGAKYCPDCGTQVI